MNRQRMKKRVIATTMALATACATIQPFEPQVGYAAETVATGNEVTENDQQEQVTPMSLTFAKGNGTSLTLEDGYKKGTTIELEGKTIENAKVKAKGSLSDLTERKSYTIKLSDKTNLLGMGKAKKWYLLSNTFDPSMLREEVALQVAEKIGLEEGALSYKRVKLNVDGTDLGTYLLVEAADGSSKRADTDWNLGEFVVEYVGNTTDEASEADVTGKDYVETETFSYRYALVDPDEMTNETSEKNYVKNVMDQIEQTIETGDLKKIARVVDVNSFAKAYVVTEYMKPVNHDIENCFFYYKGGKLHAGLLHNFQFSAGNIGSGFSEDKQKIASAEGLYADHNLYEKLCGVDAFQQLVQKEYHDLLPEIEEFYEEDGWIDSAAKVISGAGMTALDSFEADDDAKEYMADPKGTYEESVKALKDWLKARTEFLSSEDCWGEASEDALDYAEYYDAIGAADYDSIDYKDVSKVEALIDENLYQESVTQEQIDEQTAAIQEAIGKLEEKERTDLVRFALTKETEDAKIAYISTGPGVYAVSGSSVGATLTTVTNEDEVENTSQKLSWCEEGYGENKDMYVPVMEAKKTKEEKWGTAGKVYIQLECSTKGYEQLRFSAELGATKKGAKYYELQYSTDGEEWKTVETSVKELSDNKTMEELYQEEALPKECCDQDKLFVRIAVAKDETVGGDPFFEQIGGEIAINNIYLTGLSIQENGGEEGDDTDKTPTESPNDGTVTETPGNEGDKNTASPDVPNDGSNTEDPSDEGDKNTTSPDSGQQEPGTTTTAPGTNAGQQTQAPGTNAGQQSQAPTQTATTAPVQNNTGTGNSQLVLKVTYAKPVAGKAAKTVTENNPASITLYTKGITSGKIALSDGTSTGVTYTSSNDKVVKVAANGTLKAVGAGKATIHVVAAGGQSDVTVVVKKASLTVKKPKVVLKKGAKYNLKAVATPKGKISFKVSNKKLAKINSKGVMVAKKKGIVIIKISCNGMTRKCKVKIK